ncbi:hypothetical protein KSI78_24210, partial [Salmonella enterica subsp. enterica serovar Indiana]|nr:hypothetical protein [Salmonella enterica subsp. enterica serovar Indiana]
MVSPTKRGVWITQWNVYIDHAHLFQSKHRELRAKVAAVPIITSFYGTGKMIKKNWYCATCMSISHPTGLCPFTALPGWTN